VDKSLVILGSGYTARFVLPLAEGRYTRVLATSREPDRHLSHIQPDRRIRFDLTHQETWRNIPTEADLLWCFPAAPLDLVKAFAGTVELYPRRLVVLGSTSAYTTSGSSDYPPAWIDETSPIDLAQPRVQGEEFLRTICAATVLRVAGIYGPGRNPLDWIRSSRVGPSRKYVNLIHVEDLAAICLAGLERGAPGEAYNVSDGTPHTWKDICEVAEQRWSIVQISSNKPDDDRGKRIAIAKLSKNVHDTLQHPDLYEALDGMMASGDTRPY
jgi:nucleoside-diphosphate-sugar epimerase